MRSIIPRTLEGMEIVQPVQRRPKKNVWFAFFFCFVFVEKKLISISLFVNNNFFSFAFLNVQ